jgi:hypothetical protein
VFFPTVFRSLAQKTVAVIFVADFFVNCERAHSTIAFFPRVRFFHTAKQKKITCVMASATSASAVAPAAPKVAGTKKKVVGKSPTTQKQNLKDMTADKYKKSITLTDRGAQVMDQALSAFVSELTNHACELKDHAGRVKLDVVRRSI